MGCTSAKLCDQEIQKSWAASVRQSFKSKHNSHHYRRHSEQLLPPAPSSNSPYQECKLFSVRRIVPGNQIPGQIHVTGAELILYEASKQPQCWPLPSLHSYGSRDHTFCFVAGKRAPSGEASLNFFCKQAEKLEAAIKEAIFNVNGPTTLNSYNNNTLVYNNSSNDKPITYGRHARSLSSPSTYSQSSQVRTSNRSQTSRNQRKLSSNTTDSLSSHSTQSTRGSILPPIKRRKEQEEPAYALPSPCSHYPACISNCSHDTFTADHDMHRRDTETDLRHTHQNNNFTSSSLNNKSASLHSLRTHYVNIGDYDSQGSCGDGCGRGESSSEGSIKGFGNNRREDFGEWRKQPHVNYAVLVTNTSSEDNLLSSRIKRPRTKDLNYTLIDHQKTEALAKSLRDVRREKQRRLKRYASEDFL